jgi:ubiquinone/menaquinone biosynthesis C-methylase UbiE
MIKDNFADRAAVWDDPGKIEMATKFVNALLTQVEFKNEWKGLEIGAGTGLVGLQIFPKISSLLCVDTSESMLNVLREKTKDEKDISIIHGEIFEYDVQDIDLVFSSMSFHHIEDIPRTLKHLFSITKNGAKLVIGDLRTEDGSFHRFNPIPHKGFDTDELTKWVENAGFKVTTVETYNVLRSEKIPGKISEFEQFILVAEK